MKTTPIAVFVAAAALVEIFCGPQPSAANPIPTPVPNPRRPKPYFSWETIPLAFHGANRSGVYNADTLEVLSKYQMVTIEKWYTECGSQHPIQSGAWCDVEAAMYNTFNTLKSMNPNMTLIMYLNTMFDFSMYNLHGMAQELEKQGTRVWLRDKNDNLVVLCNDGNYYCDVLNFDWSQQTARDLWVSHVMNATKQGSVSGIFGDHARNMLSPPDNPQLCNGAGANRSCWSFTPEQAVAFNAGHGWLVNYTQDLLAPLGGPIIDGPYGKYNVDVCDFNALRKAVKAGQDGVAPYVIEASKGGCTPDESCIASYLLGATEYTYLSCLADEPTLLSYPDLGRKLGEPLGPAKQGADKVWTRSFKYGAVARWYPNNRGTVQWPGQPMPPVPPPGPAPPAPVPPQNVTSQCGKLQKDTTIAQDDVGVKDHCQSAQECCNFCLVTRGCAMWAWHGPEQQCHAHSEKAAGNFHSQVGTYSAVLPPKI